ncbi:MAG: DUF4445 domain-containing protein [Pseudobutyrivibrio sp.]|nr:DUF4445 domain-containing protein [Pseudobutyrivibrio sp.]
MKIVINIAELNKEYIYESRESVSLVEVMEALGLRFYRPCGGKGNCENCQVIINGVPKLGCKAIIKEDSTVEIPVRLTGQIEVPKENYETTDLDTVAVDIGTTTISVCYGNLISSVANSQIGYGSDVVSRIQSAMEDEDTASKMYNMVRADMAKAMEQIGASEAHRIIVAANTTMGHLLMGYPVDGLAAYPFTPHNLALETLKWEQREIIIMPGISAYVGADLVAGAYALDMIESNKITLLLDMGTNAEILLWDGNKLWVTSAAAGPALEGGNISCGMPSVAGAISHVFMDDNGKISYETIAGAPPAGLCGSGVIDMVACLKEHKLIDEGGLFTDESYMENKGYPVTDSVYFSQEDVQQVLLAKSAIYSGLKVLCKVAGVKLSGVNRMYVAGGLGASVSVKGAAAIGLIPPELVGCYEAVGNTSLKGAIKYSRQKNTAALENIISKATVIDLGNSDEFQNMFLESLTI